MSIKSPPLNHTPPHLKHPRSIKALLLFMATLTILAGIIIAPALPTLSKELQAQGFSMENAAFWARMMLSLPSLVIVVCAPCMGYLSDRVGRCRIILFGLILYAFSGILGGLFPAFKTMLISRLILGLSISMTMPNTIALVGDYFHGHERDTLMGYVSSFMSFGGMVYLAIAGVLTQYHWRLPFALYLLAIPAWLWAKMLLVEPPSNASITDMHDPSPKPRIPSTLWILYVTAIMTMASYFCVPTQLPFLLASHHITDPLHTSLMVSCVTLGILIMSFSYGRLRTHLSHTRIFSLGFCIVCIAYSLLGSASTMMMLSLSIFIAGIGFGCLMPNLGNSMVTFAPPALRGIAMGFMSSFLNLGQFLSPLLVYPWTGTHGVSVAFYIYAGVSAILGLFFVIFPHIFKQKK